MKMRTFDAVDTTVLNRKYAGSSNNVRARRSLMSGMSRNAQINVSEGRCTVSAPDRRTDMPFNVNEAIAVQRVAHMLRGGHDLGDAAVRESIARDLHALEQKAHQRLGAGPVDDVERWARRLADMAEDGA